MQQLGRCRCLSLLTVGGFANADGALPHERAKLDEARCQSRDIHALLLLLLLRPCSTGRTQRVDAVVGVGEVGPARVVEAEVHQRLTHVASDLKQELRYNVDASRLGTTITTPSQVHVHEANDLEQSAHGGRSVKVAREARAHQHLTLVCTVPQTRVLLRQALACLLLLLLLCGLDARLVQRVGDRVEELREARLDLLRIEHTIGCELDVAVVLVQQTKDSELVGRVVAQQLLDGDKVLERLGHLVALDVQVARV